MPLIPYPPEDKIAPECQAILDAFQRTYGRPSHIFRLMSHNPRFLIAASETWDNLVVKPGTLERWVKEAIVVITCSTQQTQYCVDGHSHALRRQGLSEEQLAAIRDHSFSGFAEPELSIFKFTQKAAGAPKSLTAGDYDTLRKAGLSEATILEVLGVVWANTAMNMIVDVLGVTLTSEQQKELSVL